MDSVISDTIVQNLFGFASAMLGAIVGGIFTMRATDKGIRSESLKEQRRDENEVQNMLDAIGAEIGTLWHFHMSRVGGMVELLQPGQALEFYYPLTQDYFTVYNSNAGLMGRVRDDVLREAVVVCYNKCKKVVDGYKYNNELYRDWRDMMDSLEGHANARSDAKFKALTDYAQVIRDDHFELKQYVERMLNLLQNRKQVMTH